MKKEKKRKSIVKKSILRIGVLGLFILVGVTVVAGIMLYSSLIKNFSVLAQTYAEMAFIRMSNDKTERLIEYPDIAQLTQILDSTGENADNTSESNKELAELAQYWYEVEYFLLEAIDSNENLKHFQVIVPQEDGVRLIWSEDLSENYDSVTSFRSYWEGEKEYLDKFTSSDMMDYLGIRKQDKNLDIQNENGDTVGTAVFPIFDNNGEKIIAFAEVVVSITDVLSSIIRLVIFITLKLSTV